MKIQRFRKQQYFSHEVAIAVYYAVNYAYEFKPGSENRYLRDFWKITYIEKAAGSICSTRSATRLRKGAFFSPGPAI